MGLAAELERELSGGIAVVVVVDVLGRVAEISGAPGTGKDPAVQERQRHRNDKDLTAIEEEYGRAA